MAVITQRQNGQWQAKIRRKGFPPQSRTFSTKTEAQVWARGVETDFARGHWRDRTAADAMSFGALLADYAGRVTPVKRGADIERLRLATLGRSRLAQYKLTALTPTVLAAWRDARLVAGRAGSTVNRELATISAVLNWGRKELGLALENPVAEIRRPANPPSRDRRFVRDEHARLLLALQDQSAEGVRPDGKKYRVGTRNPWLLPCVLLALETGLRRSELLSLNWDGVDLARRVLRARGLGGGATKNGDTWRDVPLSSAAVTVLHGLQGDPPKHAGPVLPLSADALKKGFERACARAGIDNFHFHDLRHEATSRLAEKLPNVIELASVTGHKSVQMLARYYHPRAEDLAKKLG